MRLGRENELGRAAETVEFLHPVHRLIRRCWGIDGRPEAVASLTTAVHVIIDAHLRIVDREGTGDVIKRMKRFRVVGAVVDPRALEDGVHELAARHALVEPELVEIDVWIGKYRSWTGLLHHVLHVRRQVAKD